MEDVKPLPKISGEIFVHNKIKTCFDFVDFHREIASQGAGVIKIYKE